MEEMIRVHEGAVLHYAREGRTRALPQVPTLTLGGNGKVEELPARYFTMLVASRGGLRTALGREQGFLFLSREGWEAYREAMLAVWPNDPVELLAAMEKHFASVDKADTVERERRRAYAEAKPARVAGEYA